MIQEMCLLNNTLFIVNLRSVALGIMQALYGEAEWHLTGAGVLNKVQRLFKNDTVLLSTAMRYSHRQPVSY